MTNREGLIRFRDMMVTVRDRVQRLKGAGRSAQEVIAARPTQDLDAAWNQGLVTPDAFVQMECLHHALPLPATADVHDDRGPESPSSR